MTESTTPEPAPTKSAASQPVGPRLLALPMSDELRAALTERIEFGKKKYGTELHTHNGRNPRVDALQEGLDLNQYLMQAVMELEDDIGELNDTIGELMCDWANLEEQRKEVQ